MKNTPLQKTTPTVLSLDDLAKCANYSFMDTLKCDPDAKASGADHAPRQVFSGHYVPVTPTPINQPEYVAHSKNFFRELGFADSMAESDDFVRLFTGDLSQLPEPMRKVVGPLATHFLSSAPNIPNSARSRPVTVMAMVAPFPYLRLSSMIDAGKCS